ncbi:MAG: nitroreductase [Deltaproteobacteria bacterium]|nr:MAG: nitroreductase [Deltaproteobacteria bacterium]
MPLEKKFYDLVVRNRSYRRFNEERVLTRQELEYLVSLAGKTPSAGNLQPLRFRPVYEKNEKEELFDSLFWAAYLKDWKGPSPGERPGGYIIVCRDISVKGSNWMFDTGISSQTILLGASDMGLGGCMIASFNREKVSEFIKSKDFEPVLVIALGLPGEKILLEDVHNNGSIKYYRDENDIHHVPKRKLEALLIP